MKKKHKKNKLKSYSSKPRTVSHAMTWFRPVFLKKKEKNEDFE
jgi:hypothetical protein